MYVKGVIEVEESLLKHIEKAKYEVLKHNIDANVIFIDSNIALVNGFFQGYKLNEGFGCMQEFPTSIFGLDCIYVNGLKDKLHANFIIQKRDKPNVKAIDEYSTLELLDIIKRRLDND